MAFAQASALPANRTGTFGRNAGGKGLFQGRRPETAKPPRRWNFREARENPMLDAIFGGNLEKNLTLGQECARAVLCFFYGLLMLRLSGRRTFAQMSAIDLVVSIIIGSNLSRAMTGSIPFWQTLASVAVLVGLHLALAYLVAHYPGLARQVEGRPIVLAEHGKILEGARLRCKISLDDLDESLRAQGLDGLGEIGRTKKLVLEPSGKISVIKTEA